jgi:hypothetical protein
MPAMVSFSSSPQMTSCLHCLHFPQVLVFYLDLPPPWVRHHRLSFTPTSSPFFHLVLSLSSNRSTAVSAGISTRMMACFRDIYFAHSHSVIHEVNYLFEQGAVVRHTFVLAHNVSAEKVSNAQAFDPTMFFRS